MKAVNFIIIIIIIIEIYRIGYILTPITLTLSKMFLFIVCIYLIRPVKSTKYIL